jgi:hypothetical protein
MRPGAVIVGIKGEELNRLYRRTDDGRSNDNAAWSSPANMS